MDLAFEKQSQSAVIPYGELKPRMLRARLLACSEQGFNIARGPLTQLRALLFSRLSALAVTDETWDTPPLLRADWAPRGVWVSPPEAQWLSEGQGGHVLTPRPSLHLLNHLRWHPQSAGSWLLRGLAFRDSPETLPLYRQRCFTMLEYAWLEMARAPAEKPAGLLSQLQQTAAAWGLGAGLRAVQQDGTTTALELLLPDMPPVAVARILIPSADLREAYNLGSRSVYIASISLERCCLLALAVHGTDPAGWPVDLRSGAVDESRLSGLRH